MNDLFRYAAHSPPVISWSEMYDVIGFELVSNGDELRLFLDDIKARLDERVSIGEFVGTEHSPRVLSLIHI